MTPKEAAEEIAACPFCSASRTVDTAIVRQYDSYFRNRVRCMGCGFTGPWCRAKKEAITAWNTRPHYAAQAAEVERLKAENKRLKVALGETESAKPEETKQLSIPVADVCRVVQELYAIADEWSHPNPAQARGFRKAAERVSKLIPTEIP